MTEKKNLVEEALIQMKQVEEAISENAKGILHSTMKEEINQLVKESLSEQEEDDEMESDEDEMEMDSDEEEMDMDSEEEEMTPMMSADDTIDLTDASDEEILKVFKAMGEEDGIIVKKDGEDIHLTDSGADTEYLVKLGESEEDEGVEMYEESDEELDEESEEELDEQSGKDSDVDAVIEKLFAGDDSEEMDETIYEIEMDEESDEELDEESEEEMDETIYEIEMDEESDEELDESSEEEMDEEADEEMMGEAYSHKKTKKTIKPKGHGIGSGPKFSYKKTSGGFKETMKQGTKGIGMGKPKFTYKDGKNVGGKNKVIKKTETKEAARTYGMGSESGRGLRKGITPNRNLKMESYEKEISMLRQKNDEYRKALNTFREKLNEVAIFNSNLAYATRLFTEHSTTKKEKINILRRFDEVETLKESKNLYKLLKEEFSKGETQPLKESVETKITKNVSTGSSTTLIESKTYENPQFLRIKDLMTKI
jgi:hypothetical protein